MPLFVLCFQVVNVPTSSTSHDKLLEHQISQVRQHQAQVRALQKDTMLDLPPQIPISKDGEEGYIDSQKQLRWKRPKCSSIDQLFRAPPNRTVHDRESPPPYYSNSPSLENLEKASNRGVRDFDEYRVLRCSSMSSNVSSPVANSHKDKQKQTATKTHTRTLSTNLTSGGRTRTVSTSVSPNRQMDEPPDYEGLHSSDNKNNQVSLSVDSV